jgi:hypothetical protein
MSKKNCNYPIGNRNRDLPTCSAVPQRTAPTRAPELSVFTQCTSAVKDSYVTRFRPLQDENPAET